MNKWFGIGRLTYDPDIRYSNNNGDQLCIARFTLAVDRRMKKGETDFISCVAFGKLGEFFEQYVKKGTKLAVTGRIQTGSYTNKDGQKIYTTDIVIEEAEFAESKKKEEEPQEQPRESAEGFMNIPDNIEAPFKKRG